MNLHGLWAHAYTFIPAQALKAEMKAIHFFNNQRQQLTVINKSTVIPKKQQSRQLAMYCMFSKHPLIYIDCNHSWDMKVTYEHEYIFAPSSKHIPASLLRASSNNLRMLRNFRQTCNWRGF